MIIMVVTWIIKCSDCIVVLQDDIYDYYGSDMDH
jgi:hypothetical protein